MPDLAYQAHLLGLGFDPGPLDGYIGPETVKAVEAFQEAEGLKVDGWMGPVTKLRLHELATGVSMADELPPEEGPPETVPEPLPEPTFEEPPAVAPPYDDDEPEEADDEGGSGEA